MDPSVFISYCRENIAFAERLQADLLRGGLTVWRDHTGIPTHSEEWVKDIRENIGKHAEFLVLASPEIEGSLWVQKELEIALEHKKQVHRILVGGTHGHLPPNWRVPQVTDFQGDYWGNLRRLLAALNAPDPQISSIFDLVSGSPVTVQDAAAILRGEKRFVVAGRTFIGLPVEPSGYTMTWLLAPADAHLSGPRDLAILFRFSGSRDRPTASAVLEFWAAQSKLPPWLVWVDGPVNAKKGEYELAGDHVWADAVQSSVRAVQKFGTGQPVSLFFECPVALGFAVGGRLREMFPYRLYNWRRGHPNQDAYQLVYERNPH